MSGGDKDSATASAEGVVPKQKAKSRDGVRLRPKSAESNSGRESRGGSPVYTDIDADLRRKCDYINVDKPPPFEDDDDYSYDEEDEDDDEDLNGHGFTGYAIRGSTAVSYQPSIKLRSHPALRHSLVSMTDDDIHYQQARRRRRPKNRAPPPPPAPPASSDGKDSAKKSKGGGGEDVVLSKPPSGSGHKRSRSAQLLESGGFGEARDDVTSSRDCRSPAGEPEERREAKWRPFVARAFPTPSLCFFCCSEKF